MSNNDPYTNTTLNDFASKRKTIPTGSNNNRDSNLPREPDSEETDSATTLGNHEESSDEVSICDQRPSPTIPDDVNLETGSKLATQCLREEIYASITEGTASVYAICLRGYIEFIPNNNVTDCDVSDIRAYLKRRARNGRRESTITQDLSAIKKVYTWIKIETDLQTEVDLFILDDLSASDFQTPDPINREPLDPQELELLYDSFDRHRDKLMATVAGEIGARNIDITKIKLEDIDFEKNEIELNNTKAKRRYTQPISDQLAVDLMHYIKQQREAYLIDADNEYLFPSQHGGRLSENWFCQIIKNAAERAGIQDIIGRVPLKRGEDRSESQNNKVHRVTPHTLRHTFNNLMADAEIPVEARADALDQDSIEVNKEYYTESSDEYKEYIRERLH
jgi:integrase/recombinase XerD